MSLQKIKDRIQQLLAVATNDGSTDGEKRNAMSMAQSLMRRHNLGRDDVQGNDTSRVKYDKRIVYAYGKRVTTWESSLAAIVAKHIVPTVFAVSKPRTPDIMFVGPADDAEFAAAVFYRLSRDIVERSQRRYGSYARGDGASYCLGFVKGIHDSADKPEPTNSETAIAIRKQSVILAGAKNWLAEQGVRTRTQSRQASVNNHNAYASGVRDGRQAETPGRSIVRPRIA